MAARKLIIDTDPGVDDVLAILLALAALPEELEVLLLSITYGNVDVQNCLRNVVSLFFHVEKEMRWRQEHGHRVGYETLRKTKPLVAIGPEHPLADQLLMADFFHGKDGLGGIHSTHPHLSPEETWISLFEQSKDSSQAGAAAITEELQKTETAFVPSRQSSSQEILRLLRENEPDTITIVAIGPLTNIAIAAASDPETFLRVKEVVVMGGTIETMGNITPVAEFNTFADAIAAARVYALSSANPKSTMPPAPPVQSTSSELPEALPYFLAPYPDSLSRQLRVTLFPLDITHKHKLTRGLFNSHVAPLVAQGSPLAEWMSAFLASTFSKIESLQKGVSGDAVGLDLHDPLCIWYCMMNDMTGWRFTQDEDIRIETSGQWTRGMCVTDRRTRKKRSLGDDGERAGDTGNWLSLVSGNRLARCTATPDEQVFGERLLVRVLGL